MTLDKSSSFVKAQELVESKGIKEPVFGIDLGTTNSCIAVLQTGMMPTIIELEDGSTTMPSCILWRGKEGEFVVGREAYLNRYLPGAKYSVKTMMGSEDKVVLEYNKKKLVMTPEEVSAEILKGLVKKVNYLYKSIKDVVISLPAYFSSDQVKATIKAGELAGLNVLGVVREPTAAAINYGRLAEDIKMHTTVVYDLGGGTFDNSVLRIVKTDKNSTDFLSDVYGIEENKEETPDVMYSVAAVGGDVHLGGDDIDKRLMYIFENKLNATGACPPSDIPKKVREIYLLKMEGFKKGGGQMTTFSTDFKNRKGKQVKVDVRMTIQDLTEAYKYIYDKTKKIMDETLERASIDKIDSITLVGGSTKSDILVSLLQKDYPDVFINRAVNPDESVAAGAAIYGRERQYGDADIKLFEVVPRSISVEVSKGLSIMIPRDQVLPCEATKMFTTTEDNQEVIYVPVYEGESSDPSECLYLGDAKITDYKKGEAGTVAVPVTVRVDSDGLVSLTVQVDRTVKKVDLVNVLGRQATPSELSDKDSRAVRRWEKFSEGLEGSNKSELKDLISGFKSSEVDRKTVEEFISKHVSVDKIDTSKPSTRVDSVYVDEENN